MRFLTIIILSLYLMMISTHAFYKSNKKCSGKRIHCLDDLSYRFCFNTTNSNFVYGNTKYCPKYTRCSEDEGTKICIIEKFQKVTNVSATTPIQLFKQKSTPIPKTTLPYDIRGSIKKSSTKNNMLEETKRVIPLRKTKKPTTKKPKTKRKRKPILSTLKQYLTNYKRKSAGKNKLKSKTKEKSKVPTLKQKVSLYKKPTVSTRNKLTTKKVVKKETPVKIKQTPSYEKEVLKTNPISSTTQTILTIPFTTKAATPSTNLFKSSPDGVSSTTLPSGYTKESILNTQLISNQLSTRDILISTTESTVKNAVVSTIQPGTTIFMTSKSGNKGSESTPSKFNSVNSQTLSKSSTKIFTIPTNKPLSTRKIETRSSILSILPWRTTTQTPCKILEKLIHDSVLAVSISTPSSTTITTEHPAVCKVEAKYPSLKCNEYQECRKVMWWFRWILRKCNKGYAFNPNTSSCILDPECI